MDFDEYKREIELIKKQNWMEYDLYSVIASVMRERENIKNLSLRDVSKRRKTNNGMEKVFQGLGSFPDFAVLSTEFERNKPSKEEVFGVIEIKNVEEPLIDIKENLQLKGYLLWFNNDLYTNGLIWEYYKYFPNNDITRKKIKELQNEVYNYPYKEDYPWTSDDLKLLKLADSIRPEWHISLIEGEDLNSDNSNWNNNWDTLLIELSNIIWTTSNL